MYLIIAFAALHGNILYKAMGKEGYIDVTIILNYIFMLIVVTMFGVVIFVDNPSRALPEMFFRIFGASAIVDGTLSILTVIFYKLHLNKFPKQENPLQNTMGYPNSEELPKENKRGFSIWVWILLIYLFFQIFFGFFLRSFFRLF